jgi:DNA-binding transcriptional LysR family regulator
MELAQMRYFQVMAKYESFTRASEELNITQPALSKSMAKLENELGAQLFERNGNHIVLSWIGKQFLRHCNQALLSVNNGIREIKDICGLDLGSVRISVSENIFIKHVIYDFLSRFPDASLSCQLQSTEQMRDALENGSIDFSISTALVPGEDIVWQPLYNDALTVLMSTEHPLANKEKLYLEELANERFVLGNLGYGMDSYINTLCEKAGFKPDIRYEGYDPDLAGMLIDIEKSVLLTPRSITVGVRAAKIFNPGTVVIPIADDIPNQVIGIAAKQGHFQSKAALEFYDRVTSFYSSQK